MVHCYGGYTTNVAHPEDVLQDDVCAVRLSGHDGVPLPPDHRGPAAGWSCCEAGPRLEEREEAVG